MWDSLGKLCNQSGREVKSLCVAAGHTQGAFIYDKVFKKAHEYPWRLCRRGGGDHAHDGWATGEEAVRTNLEELKEQREPSDPTTWKIWTLLQDEQGYPINLLIKAIMLLGDVPWGTVTTEQQHASCSLMHKSIQNGSWLHFC